MTSPMNTTLTMAAMLGAGMIAGTFLAFSSFIMQALAQQPHPNGMLAMQAINITVINPLFMGVLFGTAALSLWLGWQGWTMGNRWLVTGAVAYVAGVVGVTMAFNVPLNNALAVIAPDAADSSAHWTNYVDSWTLWNSVRMAASLVACGSFGWGLRTLG